jgi:hypothetical protein
VVLAEQRFGRGRVLAFTSDITYNWGQWFQDWKTKEGDWLFSKFWRNALKWLSAGRLGGERGPEVEIRPMLAEASNPVLITFRLPEAALHSSVSMDVYHKDQRVMSKRISRPDDNVLEWEIPSLEAGDYYLKVTVDREDRPQKIVKRFFTVYPFRGEARHLEARFDLLDEAAGMSGGTFLKFDEIGSLRQIVERIDREHLKQTAVPFWNQPWIYLLILGLLTVDWFARKRKGFE